MYRKILRVISNKFLLVTVLFVVQLAIFESIDLFTLLKMKSQEGQLRTQVESQKKEIKQIKRKSKSLTDPSERERFAREEYNFRKPHEKVFIISNK